MLSSKWLLPLSAVVREIMQRGNMQRRDAA